MKSRFQRPLNVRALSYTYFFCLMTLTIHANSQMLDSEWKFESQRAEISPLSFINSQTTFEGKSTLTLKGGGKDYAAGHWYQIVDVEPEAYYQFRTYFKSSQVDEPGRSILAKLLWQDADGKIVGFREYPATLLDKTRSGWNIIEQVYKVPANAKTARLELHYRWDGDGEVHFGETSFEKSDMPEKRIVRLATIHHRPKNSKSTNENLVKFAELIEKAGAEKADIVCLPEAATIVGTEHDYISGSEPVPGPTTDFLGKVAKRNNLYIVAGLLEKEGDVVYNTAVLIDRNGNFAGKYRKTSLPREEIEGGVTPGNSFPVFDTDFGRIGIMICWDVTFPESARALAKKGAEVILLPIWGGDVRLARARAIENQVYLVSSTYDMISAIFDLEGEVLEEAKNDNPVAVVEVDLNEQKLWPWLGDFKNRIPREMPSQKAIGYN